MTVIDIMKQAQTLSPQERKELVKLLVDSLDVMQQIADDQPAGITTAPKTGAEIAAMLSEMQPIEFVDAEIDDPVEWVKTQRRKEANRLKPYWSEE